MGLRVECILCRWQRLNKSLDRVSTVHDGGVSARTGPVAQGSGAGGIAVHTVKEVGAQLGWACTQMAPEQTPALDSPRSESAQPAAQQLPSSQQSLSAHTQLQQPQESMINLTVGAEAMPQKVGASGQPESQTGSHVLPSDAVEGSAMETEATPWSVSVVPSEQEFHNTTPSPSVAGCPPVTSLHTLLPGVPTGSPHWLKPVSCKEESSCM